MTNGVNNQRALPKRNVTNDYREEDDFDENAFDVDYQDEDIQS